MKKWSICPRAPGGFFCASQRVLPPTPPFPGSFPGRHSRGTFPPPHDPCLHPRTLLTVHVELDGRLLAARDGLVHAAAGEDTPNIQVCGVDEQLADGGLPLPILQQFLGWRKQGWETRLS